MAHELPSRAQFLVTAAGLAAAGVGLSLGTEAATGAFGKYEPDKSLNVLYDLKTPLPEYMTFQQDLRSDATTIAQKYVAAPTDLPVQGLLPEEFQPIVNTTAIVEAMLLMAQDAYGQAGRDRVATQLQQRGLNITVGSYSAPEKKGTADTRYQLPLPETMVGANLKYVGQNASQDVDDFQVLARANGLVTTIINEGIAPDNSSVTAQLANVGVGLAGGAIAAGVVEPMPSRAKFFGIATIGLASAMLASESFRWGQGAVHAANTAIVGGKSVGSGYDNPGDFRQLVQTDLFQTDIKRKLFIQQRIK